MHAQLSANSHLEWTNVPQRFGRLQLRETAWRVALWLLAKVSMLQSICAKRYHQILHRIVDWTAWEKPRMRNFIGWKNYQEIYVTSDPCRSTTPLGVVTVRLIKILFEWLQFWQFSICFSFSDTRPNFQKISFS